MFLTRASAYDKEVVAKTKKFVQAGGRAIATTGLMEALGDKGFQDIAEIEATGKRVIAKSSGAAGLGVSGDLGRGSRRRRVKAAAGSEHRDAGVAAFGERHMDIGAVQHGGVQLSDGGGDGAVNGVREGDILCGGDTGRFWGFVSSAGGGAESARTLLGGDKLATLEATDNVSLFIYDNKTLIVQNFRGEAVTARVGGGEAARLRDLVTNALTAGGGRGVGGGMGMGVGGGMGGGMGMGGGRGGAGGRATFEVPVAGHSSRVFAAE